VILTSLSFLRPSSLARSIRSLEVISSMRRAASSARN
jgi:hypothetical protein